MIYYIYKQNIEDGGGEGEGGGGRGCKTNEKCFSYF